MQLVETMWMLISHATDLSPRHPCTKNAGPPGIFTFTSIATISNTGQRNNNPISETNRSNIHFNIICSKFSVTK